MGNIIRLNLGWTLFLFFLLLILFWSNAGAGSAPATGFFMDMPLGMLLERFSVGNPITGALLCSLLIFINSGLLIRIVSRNMILADRSYLPIIFYVTIGAGCILGYNSLPVFVLSFLMIGSYGLMLSSFRRVVRYGDLFNSTLLAGIALLVWSHAAVYLLLLPISLVIFKKDGRGWIVALTGYVLPLAICSYVYWGMGYPISYAVDRLLNGIVGMFDAEEFVPAGWLHPALLLFWGISLAVCVLSVISSIKRASSMRTRTYKAFVYFLWILVCSLLPFCLPGRSLSDCIFVAVPMAILIPLYFIRNQTFVAQIIYLLLLGSIVVYNLFPDMAIG